MAYIQKKGTIYQITVSLGSGKDRIRKSTKFIPPDNISERTARRLATEAAAAFEREFERQFTVQGQKILTVESIVPMWEDYMLQRGIKQQSLTTYRRVLQYFIDVAGDLLLSEINYSDIYRGVQASIEQKHKNDTTYTLKHSLCSKKVKAWTGMSMSAIYTQYGVNISKNTSTVKSKTAEKLCEIFKWNLEHDFIKNETPVSEYFENMLSHAIRSLFDFAYIQDFVKFDIKKQLPVREVKQQKQHSENKKTFYDENDIQTLLHVLKEEGEEWELMIYLLLFCSLRIGELQALYVNDVDLKAGTLNVYKTLLRQRIDNKIVGTTKSKAGFRTLHVPKPLIPILQQHIAKVTREHENIPEWKKTPWLFPGTIFPKAILVEPNYCTFNNHWKAFLKRHNLPIVTIHSLRKSAATIMLENGVNIKAIQYRLGHESAQTTIDIYTKFQQKHDKSASEMFGNLLKRL
ncbi:MAG: tyrosine-type recombinase/integrase [Fastidiosipilaceae bacterium]|jgi:integrase